MAEKWLLEMTTVKEAIRVAYADLKALHFEVEAWSLRNGPILKTDNTMRGIRLRELSELLRDAEMPDFVKCA